MSADKMNRDMQNSGASDRESCIAAKDASNDDFAEWELVGPEMSDEEVLERLKGNVRNYTTAEVLAHLQRLP